MYPARVAIAPDHEKRRTSRRLVNFEGSLREGRVEASDVVVTDLSVDGCRITGTSGLQVDTAVWIKLAGLNTIRARVAWVEGSEAGCQFCTALGEGELPIATRGLTVRRVQFGTKARKR